MIMEDLSESGIGRSSETLLDLLPLIPGLPDDISLSCIARVPRKYHFGIKCVSKRWRDLITSEDWMCFRCKHGLQETWIYALCRGKYEISFYVLDPNQSETCWRPILGIPSRFLRRKGMGFEVLGKKAYLLGGCGWSEDATDEVFCFDASTNTWSEAPPLSTARCYFACEAMDGKIHSIGGLCRDSSDPRSWDTYDPHSSICISRSDPKIVSEMEDSIVMDGKIYIRSGTSGASPNVYAVVCEPSTGEWSPANPDMVSGWQGPAVFADGTLYVLDESSSGTRLMIWRKESGEWVAFGRLAAECTRPPCRLVAIGKSIYVIGKGLNTVVIDVSNAGNGEGVMMSHRMVKQFSDDDAVSCKCMTI